MAPMAEAAEENDGQKDAGSQAGEKSHKGACGGKLRAMRL